MFSEVRKCAVDKLTGEMYAVVNDTARKIGLQAYAEEEPERLEGVVGFVPKDTSIPKEFEAPGKSKVKVVDHPILVLSMNRLK